jgi:serine/threonine-protein kinase
MSRLFAATDARLNRRVVVKVLPPELISDSSTARFQREIELTVRLQHPHILPILTSGSWAEGLYYITPYIAGESLRTRIERLGKLPLAEVISILHDISGALEFAHSRQVVHRDVKPGNILLSEGNAILADFGVARANTTTGTPITVSGVRPGTPAYMPPELFATSDGDLYALGIVAHEMLTGVLPKPAPTIADIMAARGSVEGDTPARLRALAQVVAKATAAKPSARFASAPELRAALDAVKAVSPLPRRLFVTVGTLAVAAAIVVTLFERIGRPILHPDRFAVFAAALGDTIVTRLSTGVAEALEEWRGTSVLELSTRPVNERDASDVSTRARRALAESRRLNARNLVVVDARRDADSVIARLTLYDAGGDTIVRSQRVVLGSSIDVGSRVMLVRAAVNALLRDRADLPWRGPTDRATPSLGAWRAYDAGRSAIEHWELASAERLLRQALTIDPQLAPAHVWLAQTLAWQSPALGADALGSLRRALDLSARLSTPDELRAAGLLALGEGRFADACQSFSSIVRADSADLSGWLGIGDCQAQNRTVVKDPRSKTGWSFQSSYEAAARAYQRATELGSIATGSDFQGWVLGRLSGVLYAVTNHVRMGFAAKPESQTFAALPYLDHDTLAFAPYDARDLASGRFDPAPSAVERAAARNRDLLRRSAEEWVRRSPKNAAAYDSLAGWMEVSTGVATVGERPVSTIDVVRRALALASDSTQRLRLAIAEVRLLIKEAQFANARAEADSLLRSGAGGRAVEVPGVAGLAALLGRVEDVARLSQAANDRLRVHVADGRTVTLSPQIAGEAARLMAYAAFSLPGDSVSAIAERAAALVDSYFPDHAVASQVRGTVIGSALSLSYPSGASLLQAMTIQGDQTSRAYALLARGDSTAARTLLRSAQRMNEGRSAGTAIDRNLRRARLALVLRDTAYALRELDPTLRALPTLGLSLLEEVPQIVSLIRALALRAELAERIGDRATAVQCASAVVAIWSGADAVLQPLVGRMKVLARATR